MTILLLFLACIGVPIGIIANDHFLISNTYILGVQLTETVIVQTYCSGDSIVDFVTSSPIGMTHSAISNPSPGKYLLVLFQFE